MSRAWLNRWGTHAAELGAIVMPFLFEARLDPRVGRLPWAPIPLSQILTRFPKNYPQFPP